MAPFGALLKRGGKRGAHRDKAQAQADAAEPPPLPPPPIGDEFAVPVREYVRPDNQLQLSEAQLGEEMPRMLTATNPTAPKNLARFNMKERCFKFDAMVDQTVAHYSSSGWLLHKSSEEAKKQGDAERAEAEAAAKFQSEVERAAREKEAGMDVEPPDDSRQLRNRFNFGDRAAQTFNYPLREGGTMTEPPPTATTTGSCSAWEVYDEYLRDAERQRAEEAAKPKGGARRPSTAAPGHAAAAAAPPAAGAAGGGSTLQGPAAEAAAAAAQRGGAAAAAARGDDDGDAALSAAGPAVAAAAAILDRMVVQNALADVAMDFKYWDDATDSFRPGEGSLLPLWTFKCPRGRKHVTSIAWSPAYTDMFAVGYGSFHFHRQTGGLVAIHSLKNPAAAENVFVTASGVMAVDFHPTFPNLLAIGCYDGSVAVFDARRRGGAPLYQATARSGKHSDAVWQVAWQEDELQKTLQFASVSTDGDVVLWTLTRSELAPERLMRLGARAALAAGGAVAAAAAAAAGAEAPGGGAAAAAARRVGGGVCMHFHWADGREHQYLAFSSEFLASFSGHGMAVYSVRWNRLHPSVFLSASADWSLRVWDARRAAAGPVLSFDLGDAVGDAAWAPYASTVAAAVTDDGRVHVIDVAANRLTPLCSQKVVRSARLTRLAFNARHPILLVGDSKGNVTCLKLSPNLRRSGGGAAGAGAQPHAAAAPAAGVGAAAAGERFEAAERQRLDGVLEVALKGRRAAVAAAAAEAASGGSCAAA
ncbi:dynein intermediate chain [Raphidocelis subcapitata]|uniref:Dynein intermediate chain n=1 Tax=Raphidocelis subcapitata TaxID=307507 RepID=A0A2V0NZF5_9CHLO|nr:dynein intermediate chain [Raphidocelis subcapitata]|eukprot:GBF93018.1 dynein intermediate chain [Raphidocelis subcapitata]